MEVRIRVRDRKAPAHSKTFARARKDTTINGNRIDFNTK